MFFPLKSFTQSLMFFCVFASASACGDENAAKKALVWQQASEQGLFSVTLDSQVEDVIEINQFLEWILTVKTADGEAVTPARITVGGGMPMHGHGLPTQPQVSEYLGEGRYVVKGLKFSMNGRWELAFDIQSKEFQDKVVFDFKVDY